MTLQEAMEEIFGHGFLFTLRPTKGRKALWIIRKALLDYEQLKSDYTDLDNQIRKANTENDELKRLLRLAVDDFDKLANVESCYYPFCGERCPFDCTGGCEEREWKHRDEAMKLLGGTENAEN